MVKKILAVEDDRDLVRLLKFNLELQGYRFLHTEQGSLALPLVERHSPDLVLLDLMLPGLDGLEICRQLRGRKEHCRLPVIMLTARTEEADRIIGLDTGADDYVTKPFSIRELTARIRALLRRSDTAACDNRVLTRGDLQIDPRTHAVSLAGRTVDLSALEFKLLHFLASNPEIVFSREQLLDRVWGADRNVTFRSVDVYVRRLREKLETDFGPSRYVQTVYGVGYRFALAEK